MSKNLKPPKKVSTDTDTYKKAAVVEGVRQVDENLDSGFTRQGVPQANDNLGKRIFAQSVSASVPTTIRVGSKPFSPLFQEQNLQLPRDRRTLNAWLRHYYDTDPLVRNAIHLHATYPLSRFDIECEDPKIKAFNIKSR